MIYMAEAMATLHGLQFAKDMGFSRVILESDSRIVIRKFQRNEEDYSALRPTWDVKALSTCFEACHFKFTPRG